MGICQSGEDTRETEKNMQINKQLERERAIQEYKILLLGTYKTCASFSTEFLNVLSNPCKYRCWRIGQIYHFEANENH